MKPVFLVLAAFVVFTSCKKESTAAAPKAVPVTGEVVVVADSPPVVLEQPVVEEPHRTPGQHLDHALQKTGEGLQVAGEKTEEGLEIAREKTEAGLEKAAEKTGQFLQRMGEKIEQAAEKAAE